VLRSAGLLDKGWLTGSASANQGKLINIYSAMLCILLASMLKH
jgi:hypothetical protein